MDKQSSRSEPQDVTRPANGSGNPKEAVTQAAERWLAIARLYYDKLLSGRKAL